METIETTDIALIMSSITAIAAVIIPVISTAITLRHNEKIKRTELHSPKIYDAVNQLVITYFNLLHYGDPDTKYKPWTTIEESRANKEAFSDLKFSRFKPFKIACYNVLSLISDETVHREILELINTLEERFQNPDQDTDAAFERVLLRISKATSPKYSKVSKPKHTKRKATSSE